MAIIDPKYLKASDGTGSAVLAHITVARLSGATTLKVDNISKWPDFFIATTGLLASNGYITEASKREFRGRKSGVDLIIEAFEPGFADAGNTTNEVVVLKQTTGYADAVADILTKQNTDIANFLNTAGDWRPLTGITYNAGKDNKAALLNSATDLSAILPLGARLRFQRPVAAPTRSMRFIGASSQYAAKTAPTGVNITNTFTIEANIRVDLYNGQSQMFFSRTDNLAQNGFYAQIDVSGRLTIAYASGSATTSWVSKEAVNQGEIIHVAMVVSSISGKVIQGMYINGQSVLTLQTSSTATAITNTGDISMGRWQSAAQYSSVTLSEVRLWTTARTQQQILDNMLSSLTGSETGLVGLWQGDGSWNDKTANANHLTSFNGASNVEPVNALSTYEYALLTGKTSTQLTAWAGRRGGIPNAVWSQVAWSIADRPYDFPARDNWQYTRMILDQVGVIASGNTVGAWREISYTDTVVPQGNWHLKYMGSFTGTSGSPTQAYQTILTPLGVTPITDFQYMKSVDYWRVPAGVTDAYAVTALDGETDVLVATPTTFKVAGNHTGGGGTGSVYVERPGFSITYQSNYV